MRPLRAGASGIVGTAEAARAKPDGYTLLINTTPEQAAAPLESELKKYAVLIRERGMKAN